MRYQPGDLVWALDASVSKQEFPGTIKEALPLIATAFSCGEVYDVDVPDLPLSPPWIGHAFYACCLRPRRDDYQQKEAPGSREKLTEPLADDFLPIPSQPVEA